MLLLAIETSCDDTAAALIEDGKKVLSSLVSSQEEVHRRYGGVVPELASRHHVRNIVPIVKGTLEEAGKGWGELDGVAVTRGPGLVGSLLVGISLGKAIAYALGLPLVGVNHLIGHLMAIFLEREVPFPFIGLVASGGHTSLYLVKGYLDASLLGATRDDAAGEAFDKVAKYLGLGYPGGRVIEALARKGDPGAIPFPRAYLSPDSLEFSFSGVKTAVVQFLRSHRVAERDLPDIAASFQEAIIDVLVSKAIRAAETYRIPRVVVAGGVASNARLREKFEEEAAERGIEVSFPSPHLCTDNAAMIGVVGYHLLLKGRRDGWEMNALSRWPSPGEGR